MSESVLRSGFWHVTVHFKEVRIDPNADYSPESSGKWYLHRVIISSILRFHLLRASPHAHCRPDIQT